MQDDFDPRFDADSASPAPARDVLESALEAALANTAERFDPSQGWVSAQCGETDFAVLAQRLGFESPSNDKRQAYRSSTPVISVPVRFRPFRAWAGYTIAATVATILVTAGMQYIGTQDTARVATQQYETRRGEQLTRQLPDGSRITLAPESRATFAMRGDARVVELEGQAFFDIRNSASAPFIVESPGVSTRVLGTSFVVRSYADRPASQVAVVTGKVGVTPVGQQEAVVTAGYVSTILDGRVTSAQIKTVDPDILSWLDGGLIFNGTSLDDVTIELERRFDVKITIRDSSLRMRRFTMEFINPSLTEVLDVLAPTIGARYEQDGNHITLLAR